MSKSSLNGLSVAFNAQTPEDVVSLSQKIIPIGENIISSGFTISDQDIHETIEGILRVSRNACGVGPAACEALSQAGAIQLAASVVDAASNFADPALSLLITCQLLANLSSSPRVAQQICLEFDDRRWSVLACRTAKHASAVGLALFQCVKSEQSALLQLVCNRALNLSILGNCDVHDDSLGMLYTYVCLERDRLEQLYSCLGTPTETATPSAAQLKLLAILGDEAERQEEGGHSPWGIASVVFLAREALPQVVGSFPSSAQGLLLTLRQATSQTSNGGMIDALLASGAHVTLLQMLAAVEDSKSPRMSECSQDSFPQIAPYKGYKADILSVLANASFQNRPFQDTLVSCGGLDLILGQCKGDPSAPLAREWALWAIRNICEDNEYAQNAIKDLRACAPAVNQGLDRTQLSVPVDPSTGKPIIGKSEI